MAKYGQELAAATRSRLRKRDVVALDFRAGDEHPQRESNLADAARRRVMEGD